MHFRGPKLFTAFATGPPGWGYDPSQGHHIAKLALEAGVWPLKEAEDLSLFNPSRKQTCVIVFPSVPYRTAAGWRALPLTASFGNSRGTKRAGLSPVK